MVDKSKFKVVISNGVFFMMLVSACLFASSRHGVRVLNLVNHVFAASDRVKECPLSLKGLAEVRISSFLRDGSFFAYALPLLPVDGFWEFLHLVKCISFYLFSLFVFFIHYIYLPPHKIVVATSS